MTQRLLNALLIIVIVAVIGSAGYFGWRYLQPRLTNTPPPTTTGKILDHFASVQEMRAYLAAANQQSTTGFPSPSFDTTTGRTGIEPIGSAVGLGTSEQKSTTNIVDRVSTTNVQVQDIDEPDIVKTDGQSIFVSTDTPQYNLCGAGQPCPLMEQTTAPDATNSGTGSTNSATLIAPIRQPISSSTTKIVDALPVEAMQQLGTLETTGTMLLVDKTLLVFSTAVYPATTGKIVGYDVTDPAKPVTRWTTTLADQETVTTARLRNGQVTIVLQRYTVSDTPCPVQIMTVGAKEIAVPCTDIYHPIRTLPVDTVYTIMNLDPATGQVQPRLTFLGSGQQTVIAMFGDNLYLTYTVNADPIKQQYDFLTQAASDLIPQSFRDRMQRLQTYDIGLAAKVTELQAILEQYLSTLTTTERDALEQKLTDRGTAYAKDHVRETATTSIVKVAVDQGTVVANGSVPGVVLNQYALDEDQGALRIATTSGGGWWWSSQDTSVNDVYVLNSQLQPLGRVLDLGRGERIYSVRFVGARGYVVTFKQTDPFYVLDLTDPVQPKLAGELKIPGYSSYLHPLTDTLIVGIGEDRGHVKATLFDVSNPANPTDVSTYQLEQYSWSEVGQSPHAFLHDAKHQVIFLPIGAKGVVLSYANQKLTVAASADDLQAQRAVYINDTLYIIGATAITAFDETTWQIVKQLTLS